MFYAIQAYSPSQNQTQRQFLEDELKGRPITDEQYAKRAADAFAWGLNQKRFLNSTDWQPKIELINNTNVQRL